MCAPRVNLWSLIHLVILSICNRNGFRSDNMHWVFRPPHLRFRHCFTQGDSRWILGLAPPKMIVIGFKKCKEATDLSRYRSGYVRLALPVKCRLQVETDSIRVTAETREWQDGYFKDGRMRCSLFWRSPTGFSHNWGRPGKELGKRGRGRREGENRERTVLNVFIDGGWAVMDRGRGDYSLNILAWVCILHSLCSVDLRHEATCWIVNIQSWGKTFGVVLSLRRWARPEYSLLQSFDSFSM